jgi:pimeloyl-ACP methyl ester carboxylesterase
MLSLPIHIGTKVRIRVYSIYYIIHIFILLLLSITSTAALAETVYLHVKPDVIARADYQRGEAHKPAIVVLHGFLQTNDYLTLTNIKEAVVDNGHTLLAPVISLGINDRNSSLPCQATHRHTIEDNLNEINSWMQWLKLKGHSSVILIGHSFGSVEALAYLQNRQANSDAPVVEMYIGVSLIDSEYVPDIKRREQDRKTALQRLQHEDTDIYPYRLSYCHHYQATAKAFLSYANWSSEHILATLNVQSRRIKVISILGSKDKRVPTDWPDKQRKAGADVRIVKGANHFFGGNQQIALLEILDEIFANEK